MSRKIFRAALFYLLVLSLDAKKSRRVKTTKPEDDSSPQPSVVSYSTFGFNDVGSYDGFVPSSPDFATYLSSNVNNQDSPPPRLYGPAFPSSLESSGFGNMESQPQDGTFSSGDDNNAQPSILQYSSASYFNADNNNDQGQNGSPEEKYRRIVDEESNSPVYGTKLGGKNKHRLLNPFNETGAFDVYSNGNSHPSETRYSNFKVTETTHDTKPVSYGETASSHQNIYNYAPTYPPTEADEVNPSSNNTYSFNFPKVIDFTKYKQYYPTAVENKFPTATFQPVTTKQKDVKQHNNYDGHNTNNYDSHSNNNYESHGNNYNYGNHNNNFDVHSSNKNYESHSSVNYPSQPFKNTYEVKEEDQESDLPKPTSYTSNAYSNNFVSYTSPKSSLKDTKPDYDYKDKVKPTPPWSYNNTIKNWRNPVKGYEYSTDYSNMSFKYDTSVPEKEKHTRKKPFHSYTDELTPASSNVVDLSDYKFPETDYSNFKKIPGVKAHYEDDDYSSLQSKHKDLFKSDDYINQFKNLYSNNNAPSTSSLWGNVYKGPEFTSLKYPSINSHFSDEITSDVVHIKPGLKNKQKNRFSHNKYSDSKPSEWSFQNKYRPYKANKPNDWTKDVSLTRFKSEEDLLGLRTHDTSHPSYIPSYKPFNDVSDEFDYKKLVEKWRQSYLKSKYKESFRDFETYASDAKPVHVPIPKPYAIEVPRPVIVPVPEPYPVRVPIPKPVAVPIIKEINVQIEKPVPYPVYKKIPYPVEKPVPVPVEKQVPVPVVKPYPVAVPHIRPVFHHTRPHDELEEAGTDDEEDYLPRPDGYRTSKKVPFSKRPKSPRYRDRPRRPQRAPYYDRNRRQWPDRRPTRRPLELRPSPFRSPYDDEFQRSDYYLHCQRTRLC
ncbi:uncharacterized protein DDB_G0283357-like [Cydia amplana]|uniref:uncharacterized protein DDB_G0283357-like n=1 Tax=Cydia amplana TaxID=1869771 RepID=UPI002FE5F4D3